MSKDYTFSSMASPFRLQLSAMPLTNKARFEQAQFTCKDPHSYLDAEESLGSPHRHPWSWSSSAVNDNAGTLPRHQRKPLGKRSCAHAPQSTLRHLSTSSLSWSHRHGLRSSPLLARSLLLCGLNTIYFCLCCSERKPKWSEGLPLSRRPSVTIEAPAFWKAR